jgi:asparagine synthase (glutamine-hydrolysing)
VSVLAGILNRRADRPLTMAVCDNLKRAMSRNASDEVVGFQDANVALFKVDVGAFGEPAHRCDRDGTVTMLAGEPVLDLGADAATGTRARDLDHLHTAFSRGQWGVFAQTHGVYCAAHYAPASGTVTLVTDRVSIRPLYYWIGDEYVVFASALRILESLAEVPKVMDLVAISEIAELGYPVGSRTPYAGISRVTAGQIVRFSGNRASSLRYWRWDSIERSAEPIQVQLESAYDQFRSAVRRQIGGDTRVFASLSGGLDSRCVTAALRSESIDVRTLTLYATLQSQEQVFAAQFAELAGTTHQVVPRAPSSGPYVTFDARIADLWSTSPPGPDDLPDHPRVWWTGDGGSVGLGHVYVDRGVIAAMRAGDLTGAPRAWTELAPRVLRSQPAAIVRELVAADIRAALDDNRFDDPGRGFHVFLMLYEQPYALARHFEDIDLYRLEYRMPFFDPDVLAVVIAAPVDACLDHGFYTDLLGLFPPAVTSVPWQAYPGHRPCPLPIPEGLAYQWDTVRPDSEIKAGRRRLLETADRVLQGDRFPDPILAKRTVRLARWLCRAGFSRGQGSIAAADLFARYWLTCGGRYSATSAVPLESE